MQAPCCWKISDNPRYWSVKQKRTGRTDRDGHPLSEAMHLLMGEWAEAVSRRANVPVLLVRSDERRMQTRRRRDGGEDKLPRCASGCWPMRNGVFSAKASRHPFAARQGWRDGCSCRATGWFIMANHDKPSSALKTKASQQAVVQRRRRSSA